MKILKAIKKMASSEHLSLRIKREHWSDDMSVNMAPLDLNKTLLEHLEFYHYKYQGMIHLLDKNINEEDWVVVRSSPVNKFMAFASAINDVPRYDLKIRRSTWGKGEYVFCVGVTGNEIQNSPPCYYKKHDNGDVSPWTPDQIDMFSNEWEVYERN